MNDNIKLILNYVTPEDTFLEHMSKHPDVDSALDEANDVAFNTVGFPLESWTVTEFSPGNLLYVYHPNEVDKTSRYRLTITTQEA